MLEHLEAVPMSTGFDTVDSRDRNETKVKMGKIRINKFAKHIAGNTAIKVTMKSIRYNMLVCAMSHRIVS